MGHVVYNMAAPTARSLGVMGKKVSLEELHRPQGWPSQQLLELIPETPEALLT